MNADANIARAGLERSPTVNVVLNADKLTAADLVRSPIDDEANILAILVSAYLIRSPADTRLNSVLILDDCCLSLIASAVRLAVIVTETVAVTNGCAT